MEVLVSDTRNDPHPIVDQGTPLTGKIDFCFVNPASRASSHTVPIALLYLHSWLKKNSIESKIIDTKKCYKSR